MVSAISLGGHTFGDSFGEAEDAGEVRGRSVEMLMKASNDMVLFRREDVLGSADVDLTTSFGAFSSSGGCLSAAAWNTISGCRSAKTHRPARWRDGEDELVRGESRQASSH